MKVTAHTVLRLLKKYGAEDIKIILFRLPVISSHEQNLRENYGE